MTLLEPDEVAERFWSKVDKSGDCWLWTAGKTGPYGGFHPHHGQHVYAHRFAYEALIGRIPVGLHIDHLCRTKTCVKPAHLEAVTPGENTRRAVRDICKRGHARTSENTRTVPKRFRVASGEMRIGSQRRCRPCEREDALRAYYRRKSA